MPTDPADPFIAPDIKRKDVEIIGNAQNETQWSGTPNYKSLQNTVAGLGSIQGLTETILPSIKALLMPGPDNPYAKMIDQSTQGNVAAAQTDMMKRGLTGSDIELAGMSGARATGEMAKSQFFAQSAGQMAGFIKELATGDINTQRENLTMLAQLMGQKITGDQDLAMFREMLNANMEQADKNRESALWGSLIQAGGSAAGAAIMASDRRLKVDIRKVGRAAGLDIFSFRWSKVAQVFGAHDRVQYGVMAQDVAKVYPEAATEKYGWKAVDFSRLPSYVIDAIYRLEAANA